MVRRWVAPRVAPLAVCLALVVACSGEPIAGPRVLHRTRRDAGAGGPHFLRPAPDAPPLAQTTVQFYAVRGQRRQVSIMYRARPGASDSTEFLRFVVPSGSLERRPDGTPVAAGDSVLITLRVSDPDRLIVEFAPAGLGFSATEPAQLTMSYAETNDDINGDGVVDAQDEALKGLFQIWRQPQVGDLFAALTSILDRTREVVSASISGFSNYAIAY